MPIRSLGLLQARVPIYVSARSCKPAKPRSTPFANSFFTDGSCNSSPVLINIADDHLHLNQLPNPETAFNIHTSQADHRDRGKRLRLPSCLLIETASNDAPALPAAPCSRRFRCRLATIRSELFGLIRFRLRGFRRDGRWQVSRGFAIGRSWAATVPIYSPKLEGVYEVAAPYACADCHRLR